MIQVMVTGSRTYSNQEKVRYALKEIDNLYKGSITLIHGGAKGADFLADREAQILGWGIRTFHADWETHGKKAGPMRNQEMINERPNIVLAFPGENSIGTWDAVRRAKKAGIRVEVFPE